MNIGITTQEIKRFQQKDLTEKIVKYDIYVLSLDWLVRYSHLAYHMKGRGVFREHFFTRFRHKLLTLLINFRICKILAAKDF